ncbi:MAG: hypothetical protein EBT98_07990 [Opitutaceae bacterium]|nr:hypothetical protein [Opitutaceae bacterium]NBR57670.1 hypothetical protein [Opitutaceae bacterium]
MRFRGILPTPINDLEKGIERLLPAPGLKQRLTFTIGWLIYFRRVRKTLSATTARPLQGQPA